MKLQVPSAKLQRELKLQHTMGAPGRALLEFDVWSFSGVWMLGLGAFKL
jgi:hypothetical protein